MSGRSPDVALTLLLLKLVTDAFHTCSATCSCLEASVRHVYMSAQAPDLKDSHEVGRVREAEFLMRSKGPWGGLGAVLHGALLGVAMAADSARGQKESNSYVVE
jgi:hypothetical protein